MRRLLTLVVCLVVFATMLLPFPASGAVRRTSRLVAQLQARITELTNLCNERLVKIQQLQNDVAFRDTIIADLRNRMAVAGITVTPSSASQSLTAEQIYALVQKGMTLDQVITAVGEAPVLDYQSKYNYGNEERVYESWEYRKNRTVDIWTINRVVDSVNLSSW